jgi:Cu+-exporting ATPase
MKNKKFDVVGMNCSACVAHVERSVNKLDGVHSVEVSLLTNSMKVEYDENLLNDHAIEAAVENAGYSANVKEEPSESQDSKKKSN